MLVFCSHQAGCRTCFLGNLAWSVEEENVTSLFSQCGTIQQVRFATDRETGDFKGFGARAANTPLCLPFTICTIDLRNCGAVLHVVLVTESLD